MIERVQRAASRLTVASGSEGGLADREFHAHARYELLYVERGAIRIDVGGVATELIENHAAVIAPHEMHRTAPHIAPATWSIGFDACDADVRLPLVGARFQRVADEHRSCVRAIVRLLENGSRESSAYRATVERMHLTALLVSVLGGTDLRCDPPAAPYRLVRLALEAIDRRFADPIGPAEIARDLGRHPAYLTNLVREHTGKSLGTLLIERRLGVARVLLSTTETPIVDVARSVGYFDVSHFARQFARQYGAPPARWRRRNATRSS